MSSKKHSRNLAARMGRWSARHRKLAIFGWLAFVVVALRCRHVRRRAEAGNRRSGPGESGRASEILDEGFKQPAGESVLIQSDSLRASDPAFKAAIGAVLARSRDSGGRHEHPLAARRRERGSDLRRTGARRSSTSRSAATSDLAVEQDRSDPRRRRRSAGGASAALHRRVRRRERGQGARGVLHGRPQEGGLLLGSRSR